jgi:PAS domain-containing protein
VLVLCDGEVVLANHAVCALTGLDRDGLVGGPAPA